MDECMGRKIENAFAFVRFSFLALHERVSSVLYLRRWHEYLLLQWFCRVFLSFPRVGTLINELCDYLFLNGFNVLTKDWRIAQFAWDGFQNRLHAARWGAEIHRLWVYSFWILYVGVKHHTAALGNKQSKGFDLVSVDTPLLSLLMRNLAHAHKSNVKWHKATIWNTSVRMKASILCSYSGLQTVPSSSAVRPAAVNVNEKRKNRAECN